MKLKSVNKLFDYIFAGGAVIIFLIVVMGIYWGGSSQPDPVETRYYEYNTVIQQLITDIIKTETELTLTQEQLYNLADIVGPKLGLPPKN